MTRSNNRPWLGREEKITKVAPETGWKENSKRIKNQRIANVIATNLEYRSILYLLVGHTRNLLPNFNVVQISFWIMCWHLYKEAKKGNSYLSDVDNDRPWSERINLAELNFLKWALPQNRAKWSFDRQKWIKLKNCVRFFFDSRQNCATFKRPPFVWRTQSLQNRNPSDADFPFFSHKIHISVIVKNLDFCFGTRQKYSSGAFYVFGGFAKNMAVRDSAEDLIGGRLR